VHPHPPIRPDEPKLPALKVAPQRRDTPQGATVNGDALWRGGYRQIEQTLALLVHHPDVDARTLQRFATALDAHLNTADNLLYPVVESARKCALGRQRELNRRLRFLLAKATQSGVDRASRRRRLRALESCFRQHARLDEAWIVPCLQSELGA